MRKSVPRDLLEQAARAAKNGYAPYSKFAVGAAVRTIDGSVFVGANMENASFGMTMCAEVGAIQSASTHGKLGDITQIAVVGGRVRGFGKRPGKIVTPCGRCRQLLLESAQLGKREIRVWCADSTLSSVEGFNISKLLPHGFGPANLSD